MPKITKRVVDASKIREKDYVIWDDELPGFGLRVFASGKRSYVLQYRALGRSRRYTIGLHGVWTPETARQEAKILFGRVAQGEDPAEDRQLDRKSVRVLQRISMMRARHYLSAWAGFTFQRGAGWASAQGYAARRSGCTSLTTKLDQGMEIGTATHACRRF